MKKQPDSPDLSRRSFLRKTGAGVAIATTTPIASWIIPTSTGEASIVAHASATIDAVAEVNPAHFSAIEHFIDSIYHVRKESLEVQTLNTLLRTSFTTEHVSDILEFHARGLNNLRVLDAFLRPDWEDLAEIKPNVDTIRAYLQSDAFKRNTNFRQFLNSGKSIEQAADELYQMAKIPITQVDNEIQQLKSSVKPLYDKFEADCARYPILSNEIERYKRPKHMWEHMMPSFGTRYRENESPIPNNYYEQPQPTAWRDRMAESIAKEKTSASER